MGRQRWFLVGLWSFWLIALLVLFLAARPFFAHLAWVPGRTLHFDQTVQKTLDDYRTIGTAAEQALEIHGDMPGVLSTLSLMHFLDMQAQQDPAQRETLRLQAIETVEQSLTQSPFNPFALLRLSTLHLSAPNPQWMPAIEAWRGAVTTGSYERFLVFNRVTIGAQLSFFMSADDLALLGEQASWAYDLDREQLAAALPRSIDKISVAKQLAAWPEKAEWLLGLASGQ